MQHDSPSSTLQTLYKAAAPYTGKRLMRSWVCDSSYEMTVDDLWTEFLGERLRFYGTDDTGARKREREGVRGRKRTGDIAVMWYVPEPQGNQDTKEVYVYSAE